MDKNWQKASLELRDFVTSNPSIEIGQNAMVIPGDVRPQFYRLFDKTRTAFISDNFPELLEKAEVLSRAYRQTAASVQNALNLENIDLSAGLNWFLQNPLDGLMRLLFEPLFDLLKGKCDITAFEEIASLVVQDTFKLYFHEGYQRWATLAFMQSAAPDRIWNVKVEDYIQDPSTSGGDLAPGDHVEQVPAPVETRKIVFTQHLYCSFLTPKAIVHSNRLGLFMGLRTDFYETRWTASSHSEKQYWLDLDAIYSQHGRSGLWPDLAVYLDESGPCDLSLVADYYRVAQPDVIIEFMEDADWYQAGKLEQIRRHYQVLHPRLGSFIACRETLPENVLKDIDKNPLEVAGTAQKQPIPSDIRLLNVGYDPAGFEPVFNAILDRQAKQPP